MRTYRRIVTGLDDAGRSVVISDEPCPNVFGPPGDPGLINFWATQATPADYRDPQDPALGDVPLHPATGGVTFRFFRVPPERRFAHLDPDARRAGAAEYYARVGAPEAYVPEGRHPGFHRTHSIDFIVLLEGEVTLMLDEADIEMRPFDVVVQRGTSHAWVNHGDAPALMMAVLVDATAGRGEGR